VKRALSSWGIFVPGVLWRPIAVATAIISTVGIVLFFRNWPRLNTVAAQGMKIVALPWPHN